MIVVLAAGRRNLAHVLVAAGALGCSSLHGIAVGPVAARSEGHTSYGDELRARAGLGSSDGASMTTFDVSASVRATKRSQAVTGDFGPSFASWFGPALLAFTPAAGLGFERYAHKLFVDPALHLTLGGGLALDESTTTLRSRPFLLAAPDTPYVEPGVGSHAARERYSTVRRKRTLLTLELRGGIEPRFTREPLWTLGVFVGLTFASEVFGERLRLKGVPLRVW